MLGFPRFLAAGQTTVGHWVHREGLLHEAEEEQSPMSRRTAVEAEGELVEIVGQLRSLDSALVRSQQPPLQK